MMKPARITKSRMISDFLLVFTLLLQAWSSDGQNNNEGAQA